MDECPHCGSTITDRDHIFCGSCGESLLAAEASEDSESWESGASESAERDSWTWGRTDENAESERRTHGTESSEGCPKCGHEETSIDEIATTGSGLSRYFDVQNRSFTVISCEDCGYSELYKNQSAGNAVDYFLSRK